jgi:hypothetical protein
MRRLDFKSCSVCTVAPCVQKYSYVCNDFVSFNKRWFWLVPISVYLHVSIKPNHLDEYVDDDYK